MAESRPQLLQCQLKSDLTLPAASHAEPGGQIPGRVERPVVYHLVHLGLHRDGTPVHRQRQLRVLHAQRVVVPLVITHLVRGGGEGSEVSQ